MAHARELAAEKKVNYKRCQFPLKLDFVWVVGGTDEMLFDLDDEHETKET